MDACCQLMALRKSSRLSFHLAEDLLSEERSRPCVSSGMDPQEIIGISHRNISWLAYRRLGRVSFTVLWCCEPLDLVWDMLYQFKSQWNVSISLWEDEIRMRKHLCGNRVICHHKHSPNFIGVDVTLDKDAWRALIEKIRRYVQDLRRCLPVNLL